MDVHQYFESRIEGEPPSDQQEVRFPAVTIYRDIRGRRPHTERERVEARDLRNRERREREERERDNLRSLRQIGDMGDVPLSERRPPARLSAVPSAPSEYVSNSDDEPWVDPIVRIPATAIPLPDRVYTSEDETDSDGWGVRVTSARPS